MSADQPGYPAQSGTAQAQHPAQHPAPDPKHAADLQRLKVLEGQVAAGEVEIAQIKTRLGLVPPKMMPAGGGGGTDNPSTGSVPAPAAPAPEAKAPTGS